MATSFALAITSSEWQAARGETPDNPEPLPLSVLAAGVGSLLLLTVVLVGVLFSKANLGGSKDAAAAAPAAESLPSAGEEDPIERLLNKMIASVPSGGPPVEETKAKAETVAGTENSPADSKVPGTKEGSSSTSGKGFGKPTK